jgi:hypothetical protein
MLIIKPIQIVTLKPKNSKKNIFLYFQLENGYTGGIHPVWRTLIRLRKTNEKAFASYIERIQEDTKSGENNTAFVHFISEIYETMLSERHGKWQPEKLSFTTTVSKIQQTASNVANIVKAVSMLSEVRQTQLLEAFPTIASEGKQIVQIMNKTSGTVVLVTLSAIYLGFEAIKNLRLWWKGEISGKRCAKHCIDATFSAVAGGLGGVGGSIVGGFFGPIGAIAGAVIGGAVSSYGAQALIEYLTQKIFDLPKEVATEKAYDFLGVKASASNAEINTAYRKLCHQHHPDRPGGNSEKFLEVQCQMATVKLHRGDL